MMAPKVLLRSDHLICYHPGDLACKFYWQDLQQVWVVGQHHQWSWLLLAEVSQAWVPFGYAGEAELRQHLLRLPRFDYDRLILDVSDAEQGRHCLWSRP